MTAKRIGIALIALLVISILLTVLAGGAKASAGCATRSKTYEYKVLGVRLWWIRITGSGCWNAKNTKVTSFSAGGSGGANNPYQYNGISGREPVGAVGTHMAGKLLTYVIGQCVPFVGCTNILYPMGRIVLDSYGSWDIRIPY